MKAATRLLLPSWMISIRFLRVILILKLIPTLSTRLWIFLFFLIRHLPKFKRITAHPSRPQLLRLLRTSTRNRVVHPHLPPAHPPHRRSRAEHGQRADDAEEGGVLSEHCVRVGRRGVGGEGRRRLAWYRGVVFG